MLSRWPILFKLLLGVGILLLMVVTLSVSGFRGVYSFRQLTKSIKVRATELPLAAQLTQSVCQLRVTVSRIRQYSDLPIPSPSAAGDPNVSQSMLREEFRTDLIAVNDALRGYRQQLISALPGDPRIADNRHEQETVREIERSLERVALLNEDKDWVLNNIQVITLDEELEELQRLTSTLPGFMTQRMHDFAEEARSQYRTWIALCWITTILAVLMLGFSALQFHRWIFHPLSILVEGSRRVARGEFDHRIQLHTQDEVAELAQAMNAMTTRFQEIRDDLDRQVKARTKEVVRSEQMASVGFLAAGVAHEINNPLASIAWAAESLESRVQDIIQADDALPDEEHDPEVVVLRKYLRRIQDEAFRCKGITERLLDFSRMGDVTRQDTDLGDLIQGVIEMIQHLGKYREKHVRFERSGRVTACVNSQELKQVILNLVTNGLDSLDPGGTVTVQLSRHEGVSEILVRDDGCGMTRDVLEHVFEPFFTRRRDGQGTGLGLSITYRIIAEHGGTIDVTSDGPGRGSQFRVTLPLVQDEEKGRPKKLQVA